MDQILFDQSETYSTGARRPKGFLRKLIERLFFLACFLAACVLLALEATEPFSKPDACIECHEMKPVHERWSKSAHFSNASGITVECIDCHLPPREDTFEHLAVKTQKGAQHGWTHFTGEFDQAKSRKLVLDTMKNQQCTHCHDNLTAKSSTPAVGAVHATALAETDKKTRTYACTTCHAFLHTDPPPPPEQEYYDQADNSYCYDCHAYLKEQKEPLIVRHRAANVGCVDCHGESEAHVGDESCETPPDIMYAKDQINVACGKKGCHSERKLKKVTSHLPWYAGADPDNTNRKYCTDCHGNHRIPDRNKKWDKKTRKLIWADGHAIDPNAKPTTKPDDEESMGM
jgi:nitrate/TMAO reductase-like tetraheme cytochrome c subunit